jgi:hypothetical protein
MRQPNERCLFLTFSFTSVPAKGSVVLFLGSGRQLERARGFVHRHFLVIFWKKVHLPVFKTAYHTI